MANRGTLRQYFTQGAGLDTRIKSNNPDIALFSTIFEWSVKSQDILTNTSVIAWTLKIETYDLSKWQSLKIGFGSVESLLVGTTDYPYTDIQVKIDGNTEYTSDNYSLSIASNALATLASGEATISHNSDGVLTPTVATTVRIKDLYDASGEPSINDGDLNATCSFSGTITPDPIPRHAVILSAPDFTDEDSPTITFAIPSGATNVRAYISFSTSTIDIGSYAVSGSSYTFSFTEAEKKKLWNILDQGLRTKQVYFYVMSDFQGTTYYSSLTRNLTIINYLPTLDPEVWDSNTDCVSRLTGNQYILVKGVSNASYTTGGLARKGASIDSQVTTNGGISKHGASGVFEKVTDNVFNFVITDSRGNNTPATMEFSRAAGRFIDYVKLTCSVEVTEMTADGDVQVKITGKCFTGDFGIKTNRLRVFYDIAKNNDEDFTHVDLGYANYASNYGNSFYVSGNDYTYTLNITGLEYLSVYDLTVWVADEVATTGVSAFTVLASTPIFDWGRTDFNFNVPVAIQGNLDLNGNLDVSGTLKVGGYTMPTIVAQGTSSSWTYRKWSDGLYECWRTLSVTSAVATSTNANWYSSGELSTTNLTFPITFTERPTTVVQTMPTGSSYCIVFPSNTTGSTTKTGSYQLMSMSSLTSRAHLLTYQVKGKWK